ncbi:MAG: DEAD/DEAH box helicase [Brevibacterium sp.]|uniref:DEAD/DEAH box helicase n=1 Tax=Brevibacterium sp. TaxID=1701 RepID=UPI0026482E6B|nr:DEAD/DEAH box helicase [Brevibacterium sp.]MDN6156493.1 DEAD/DEAH box helicase [Brevibacterium sp.]MDN6527824.1 DEAD/DEAH box helicase [Brevibacterium sp.]MDN6605221.1 DEAD/DEAH box helicase [Brevibacterium sp.]MDN6745495.1 DEAD/DEAH box helicase [Brevibacterium sp.]
MSADRLPGTSAAEQLPPAFPERAAWGTAGKLRAWQAEALEQYFRDQPKDFLAVATPGAGKTTFALRVAAELLAQRVVNRVTVVAPTEHLKVQWADSASRVGIKLDPQFKNAQGKHAPGYHGVAITYAQVAAKPVLHHNRTAAGRTLVILDEVHHGGDALSWGDAVREAFDPAVRRLSLTGTPFRSDTSPIPFVTYAPDENGIRTSVADYSYGYGRALKDSVVRPVMFLAYAGAMSWRTRAGDEMSHVLGEETTKDINAQAWRTALDPAGDWIPAVLKAADLRLTEVRRTVHDAGGLVIATDQDNARAYAKVLRELTGEAPTVVLSDEAGASARIEQFQNSTDRWMVAVRMVSEGVDVPRLCVGVYATSSATPLFFAQAIGRFVRARKRGETASVFLPSVPILMALANSMEVERDHALDRPKNEDENDVVVFDDQAMEQANREEGASDQMGSFEALGAEALFDRVLFDGGEFGTGGAIGSEDELDFIGIPGLLEPDQVHELLRTQQARQAKRKTAAAPPAPETQPSELDHRAMKEERNQLQSLVGAWSRRTGSPHKTVHVELRKACGGPPVAQATREQIQARIKKLQGWFVGKK